MKIYKVNDKRIYLSLLLLADEQESMIDRYIDKGEMYVLDDDGVKAEIVVCDEGNGILEIKNLAVEPQYKRQGYGKKLVEFVCEHYKAKYHTIRVGTGNSPLTVPFYEKCGFKRSEVIKDFFTENYDHPIYECGIRLVDMIYFTKELR
ncbi:MAG: GNAT family N-acetyltransferase [Clostridia bacterium]|nr:GNAT family N-acetyltransferase [Clostridia bacterium]